MCDVVALGNTPAPDPPWGPILWNGSDSDGTKTGAIEIPAEYFNPSASTSYALPQAGTGEFITATQIGPVIPAGTSNPPVWADRWSQVASSSASFSAGDLLSFAGPTTPGQFSQQIAISVDQIQDASNNILPPGMSGKIHKWHFVWGGQYTSLPDATMTLDTSHSYVAHGITGASASFTPAWSGWSVMDQGTTIDNTVTQTGYTVGSTVTFGLAGGTLNGTQSPEIVVMAVSPANAVTGWQWLNYGSYSAIPGAATDLVQASASCSPTCIGLQFVPEWTRGALATTIENAIDCRSSCTPGQCTTGYVCIYPTDEPSGVQPGRIQVIEGLYYGHDDGAAIQAALANTQPGTNSAYAPGAVRVTGFCGTTIPVTLPGANGTSTTAPTSVALAGDTYKASGLIAFAYDTGDRSSHPLLNHVINGYTQSFGGGVRDLMIEGGGVTQGYGYCGLYSSTCSVGGGTVTAPIGYNGPTSGSCPAPRCQQSTGSVVEIDKANEAYFTNLAVYDAYGEGNAEFQVGFNDADPTSVITSDVGTSFIDSVRTDVTNNQIGPLNPEYAFNIDGMHDSQITRLDAFDGTEADIREGQGNIYSGIHTVSNVLNGIHGASGVTAAQINWSPILSANLMLAGVSLYGIESAKNLFLTNMQCDTVWIACIYLGESESSGTDTPAMVTNVAQKCANAFANVWPTYTGVLLAPGIAGTAVSNVTAKPSACGIANTQLVSEQSSVKVNQGNVDPSVQAVSQNLTAQFCSPSAGFVTGRYYTTAYGTQSTTGISGDNLYAVPVQLPCMVTASQLSIQVNHVSGSGPCELGIYGNNGAGQPGFLIYDAGHIPVASAGTKSITLPTPQLMGPGLVFLVVGCDTGSSLTVEAGIGGASNGILGLAAPGDANDFISSTWTYSAGNLPNPFPAFAGASGPTPLVFFSPQ